jgi:hypothetical protein
MKIDVVRNTESRRPYNAFVSDHPHVQGFGKSQKEALGDLVTNCPEMFNAVLVKLGRPAPYADHHSNLTPEQE